MTIRDILIERYLVSDFTFGFEYEGFVRKDRVRFPRNIGLEVFFDEYFKGGAVEGDLSITPPNRLYHSFEYKSPILQATPDNFQKLIRLLEASLKWGIQTNETCGFHIHVGFPQLNALDTKWSLCQIALDKETIELIRKLGEIQFNQRNYAQIKAFTDLAISVRRGYWNNVAKKLSNKYQILYAHPQGTIEWRGPRNFITSENIGLIHQFVVLLHKFISRLSYLQTLSTLGRVGQGVVTKREFADKMSLVPPGERLIQTFNMKIMYPKDVKEIMSVYGKWLKTCSFKDAIMVYREGRLEWRGGTWISGEWKGWFPPPLPVVST